MVWKFLSSYSKRLPNTIWHMMLATALLNNCAGLNGSPENQIKLWLFVIFRKRFSGNGQKFYIKQNENRRLHTVIFIYTLMTRPSRSRHDLASSRQFLSENLCGLPRFRPCILQSCRLSVIIIHFRHYPAYPVPQIISSPSSVPSKGRTATTFKNVLLVSLSL